MNASKTDGWGSRTIIPDMNQGFDRVVAGGHGMKKFGQATQRPFTIDKIDSADYPLFDEFEGAPDGAGSMMKAGKEHEVGIVNQRSVKCNSGVGRTTAEEINCATLAHQPDGGFPDLGLADRFDEPQAAELAGLDLARVQHFWFAEEIALEQLVAQLLGATLQLLLQTFTHLLGGGGLLLSQLGDAVTGARRGRKNAKAEEARKRRQDA